MVAVTSLPAAATRRTPARSHASLRVVPQVHGLGSSVPRHLRTAALAFVLVVAAALALALARMPQVDLSSTRTVGTHVVAPGDSMWSIAVEHAPAGGAGGYVERLIEANGTARVSAGDVVVLPAG